MCKNQSREEYVLAVSSDQRVQTRIRRKRGERLNWLAPVCEFCDNILIRNQPHVYYIQSEPSRSLSNTQPTPNTPYPLRLRA